MQITREPKQVAVRMLAPALPEARTNTFFVFQPGSHTADLRSSRYAGGVSPQNLSCGFTNPFPATRRVTLFQDQDESGVEVVAGDGADVLTHYDPASGCCVYRWGTCMHPTVGKEALLRWVLNVVNSEDHSPLRELLGLFIIVIDDRRNRRVRMVSDLVGVRPWFVGSNHGRLVCGSDVWGIQRAGFDMGGVNYDAVASWLRLLYDCTGSGLFAGFPSMGYGAVGTWENGTYTEKPYFGLTGGLAMPPREQMWEEMYQRVARPFDAMMRDVDRVSIPLSGGYDSRFMAALASKKRDLEVETFCLCDREAEGEAAMAVAEALGLKLEVLRTDGARWNLFAEPYDFGADGFPITKQSSHVVASQRPGVPIISGFFGDPINRGSRDRIEGKLEREITEDMAAVYHRSLIGKHEICRFDLLDPQVLGRSDGRLRPIFRQNLAKFEHTQHPIICTELFSRQRRYMANNVMQFMHISEPLLPFMSFDAIQYKMMNDATMHSYDNYAGLLNRYFPELTHVPHNLKMGVKNHLLITKPSRVTKRWAATVLTNVARSQCLSLLSPRKAVPRLIGALTGRRDMEAVALSTYRLLMLEKELHGAGIAFDWNQL